MTPATARIDFEPMPASGTGAHLGDRAALVALYNATGGADWKDNTNWLSDGPLDDWYGVTTDANGRVTELNLRNNDLAGEMPGIWGTSRTCKNWNWEAVIGVTPMSVSQVRLRPTS